MNAVLQKAIQLAYEKAIEVHPTEKKRIARALRIAESNRVELFTRQNYARVLSDTGRQNYTVRWNAHNRTGECNCVDHNTRAPEQRCKHRYAVWLIRRALKIMEQSYYVDPVNGVQCGNVLLSEMQKALDGNLIDKVCNRY